MATNYIISAKTWSFFLVSIQVPFAYQANALPIELKKDMVQPVGIEPTSTALQAAAMTTSAKVAWWRIADSNCLLMLAKHMCSQLAPIPPLLVKLCLIKFLLINQTISFTPSTTTMVFTTNRNILRMTISNFFSGLTFFTKSSRHMILLILVSVEGIKPSTHGPKPRMLSLHYTELNWYIVTGSNRGPPPCKGIALPLS